jgi:hypothetical protein
VLENQIVIPRTDIEDGLRRKPGVFYNDVHRSHSPQRITGPSAFIRIAGVAATRPISQPPIEGAFYLFSTCILTWAKVNTLRSGASIRDMYKANKLR